MIHHHYCDKNKNVVKMSFFGKMFGGKAEPVMTTGEAIQKLRETEDILIKKQEFLEKKIENEIETAKKNGSKNKRGIVSVSFVFDIKMIFFYLVND